MKYQYREKENASKLLYAKDLSGLPSGISLAFNNVHVRFYKSQEMNGYFYATLAIPAFTDGEGYVLEIEFNEVISSEDDTDFATYTVPFHDHTFDSLTKSVACHFEEKHDMGRRSLLLIMKINGTPFNGYVFIDDSLYNEV